MIIPFEVQTALKILQNSQNEAYIVGGAVRNSLLNNEINDYDITTSATPNTIKILFSDYNQYRVGEKHGTVVVLIGDYKIDITTFRKDNNYIDHRHPESVEYTTDLYEDLKRRDFTINALCLDINNNLIDLFDGVNDLQNKIIKAIGNPNTRFNEDALRILRAIKFASRLDFEIEQETKKALFTNKDLLNKIANERKKEELLQILSVKDKTKYINEYLEIFNTFIPFKKVDQTLNNFLDPYFSLAYLLSNTEGYDLKKLKFSKYEINLLNALVKVTNININDDYIFITNLSSMFELEIKTYLEQLLNINLDERYKSLKPYIVDLNSLNINGKKLMEYGLKDQQIKDMKLQIIEEIRNKRLTNDFDAITKYLNSVLYNN